MVMLWSSLAERKVNLMTKAIQNMPGIPSGCSWITYVRGHDDIGWAIADDDMQDLHMNPDDHRQFLTAFYTGRFEGSFAKGLPFQEKPEQLAIC